MEESTPEPGFIEWLRSGWNWLSLAGTAVAVAAVLAVTQSGTPNSRPMAAADSAAIDEVVHSADFSVIANLDVLIAMDENDLWLQASAR
jgi:hydrogenase maturation factor HypF (carbamoyltransferase family)